MAEYFRDQTGKDTLLFVDNIFRFSQAGSEVSALFGTNAFGGGLPAHPGDRNGCPAGTNCFDQTKVRSRRYRPFTFLRTIPTDPAPATAFGQLDAFLYLERSISEKGIYPCGGSAGIVVAYSGPGLRG